MRKQQKILTVLLLVLLVISAGWIWLMMRPAHETTVSKRIVVTTNAQAQIFNKLDVPLVGVPTPGAQQSLPKNTASFDDIYPALLCGYTSLQPGL